MFFLILTSLFLNAPSIAETHLRELRQDEIQEDFSQLTRLIETLYAPLAYKENRFSFSFQSLKAETSLELKKAKTDSEVFSIFQKFLATLNDGHVSLTVPVDSSIPQSFDIGFKVKLFGKKPLVVEISPEAKLAGVEVGDEIIAIDSETPSSLLEKITIYRSFGNDLTNTHLLALAFQRPSDLIPLLPIAEFANVALKKGNGSTKIALLSWKRSLEKVSFEAKDLGAKEPHFFKTAHIKALKLDVVSLSGKYLRRFGLKEEEIEKPFAFTYAYKGKRILFLRIDSFQANSIAQISTQLRKLGAVLNQEDDSDALVLDLTHNAGGNISFALELFGFLANTASKNILEIIHADRENYDTFQKRIKLGSNSELKTEASKGIETAYDAGIPLAGPYPFQGRTQIFPNSAFYWKKPILILQDELTCSAAEVISFLAKTNVRAKIFGTTSAGMGGEVEEVATLTHSRARLKLTRSLFQIDGKFIENEGVEPDLRYDLTPDDDRNQYTRFFQTFSEAVFQMIPAKP